MYSKIKSCVVHENVFSDFFACDIGVRQGENLSPLLFSFYLNDIEDFFENQQLQNVELINSLTAQYLGVYIRLFILLYADDALLISETQEGL